jgi:hypothetical protein
MSKPPLRLSNVGKRRRISRHDSFWNRSPIQPLPRCVKRDWRNGPLFFIETISQITTVLERTMRTAFFSEFSFRVKTNPAQLGWFGYSIFGWTGPRSLQPNPGHRSICVSSVSIAAVSGRLPGSSSERSWRSLGTQVSKHEPARISSSVMSVSRETD